MAPGGSQHLRPRRKATVKNPFRAYCIVLCWCGVNILVAYILKLLEHGSVPARAVVTVGSLLGNYAYATLLFRELFEDDGED